MVKKSSGKVSCKTDSAKGQKAKAAAKSKYKELLESIKRMHEADRILAEGLADFLTKTKKAKKSTNRSMSK